MSSGRNEIEFFSDLWKGGYYSGDPMDPVGRSDYGDMGYISVHHATYQVCIRPYVGPDKFVLEIGPGRGSWTQTMLNAKEIWCLDALSAEHNKFWEYVGVENEKKVKYIEVEDFSCGNLPEGYFDFLFSFGTFCHITWEAQCEYYRNLYSKLRPGANAMIMFADFDKYNNAVLNFKRLRVRKINGNVLFSSARDIFSAIRSYPERIMRGGTNAPFPLLDKNDKTPAPGKWHHAGINETCRALKSMGWDVINPDVGLNLRDPIIHFRKP